VFVVLGLLFLVLFLVKPALTQHFALHFMAARRMVKGVLGMLLHVKKATSLSPLASDIRQARRTALQLRAA
jgi:hypothetical protein